VAETPPLRIPFRDHVVSTPAPPGGGIVLAEMLAILARFDLAAMGHNSARYIHVVSEATRIALADREAHIGDPATHPPPLDHLLGEAHAEAMAARIGAGLRAPARDSGLRAPARDSGLRAPARDAAGEPRETTTISVVDRAGMVATLTHTLGVPPGVIVPGTGFMLNGAMNWYDPRPGRPGSIAPGRKRFSSMAPTIIFDAAGRAVATLGAPGGAWIGLALAQVILNLLEFGMGMQEAVLAPRFAATTPAIDISNRIPRAVQKELEAMGHTVRRAFHSYPFAAPHGIALWDGLEGGADPQRDGMAMGVA
jgi:gamma-glutamyltranspeptidase/glutathione hydrolase